MPKRLTARQTICARLLLEIIQRIAAHVLDVENFGSHADEVLLCSAIWIGHIEGRPMTAAKLAAYIGMPRATVARKLASLHSRGIVKPLSKMRWCLEIAAGNPGAFQALSDANIASVQRAAEKLSKMDSFTVAQGEFGRIQGRNGDST